jgi:hypothetical protein
MGSAEENIHEYLKSVVPGWNHHGWKGRIKEERKPISDLPNLYIWYPKTIEECNQKEKMEPIPPVVAISNTEEEWIIVDGCHRTSSYFHHLSKEPQAILVIVGPMTHNWYKGNGEARLVKDYFKN